jgi:hypothetical protein
MAAATSCALAARIAAASVSSREAMAASAASRVSVLALRMARAAARPRMLISLCVVALMVAKDIGWSALGERCG